MTPNLNHLFCNQPFFPEKQNRMKTPRPQKLSFSGMEQVQKETAGQTHSL